MGDRLATSQAPQLALECLTVEDRFEELRVEQLMGPDDHQAPLGNCQGPHSPGGTRLVSTDDRRGRPHKKNLANRPVDREEKVSVTNELIWANACARLLTKEALAKPKNAFNQVADAN